MQIDPVTSSANHALAMPRSQVYVSQSRVDETTADTVDTSTARQIADIAAEYDVRNISPRDMAAMSLSLYESGHISFKTHALLSFQPELHPEYDATLGKISGVPAQPDEKRDFIQVWEKKLESQKRYAAPAEQIKNTEEVLNLLRNLAALRDSNL